jgi:hypothetical protein
MPNPFRSLSSRIESPGQARHRVAGARLGEGRMATIVAKPAWNRGLILLVVAAVLIN